MFSLYRMTALAAVVPLLAACAGREPAPMETAKVTDRTLSCTQIEQEIQGNNRMMAELAGEEGTKVAQNIAAGIGGLVFFPLWFAMDFQDAAGKEGIALQNRNNHLAAMHGDRCSGMTNIG